MSRIILFKRNLGAEVHSAHDSTLRQTADGDRRAIKGLLSPFRYKIRLMRDLIVDQYDIRRMIGFDIREHFLTDVEERLHEAIEAEIGSYDPLDPRNIPFQAPEEAGELVEGWSDTLIDLGLIDDDTSVVFREMAVCCIRGALSVKKILSNTGKLEKVKRYMEYGQALRTTEASRTYFRDQLCKSLPPEMTDRALEYLAVTVCPPIVQLKAKDDGAVRWNDSPVPEELKSLPTLDLLVHWCLQGLGQSQLVLWSGKKHCPGYTIDTTDAMTVLGTRMKEAIIKNIGIAHPALFANDSHPDRIPMPIALKEHSKHIRFLHLSIELKYNSHGSYPVDIFQAQKSIHTLTTYMPNLQSVTVTVVEYPSRNATSLAPRGPYLRQGRPKPGQAQFTTIEAEMEKLIKAMDNLAVKKRSLIYYDQEMAWNLTGTTEGPMEKWTPETAPIGVGEAEEGDDEKVIVDALKEYMGCELTLYNTDD